MLSLNSIGGCILDFAVSRFKGIAVFQPVINGKFQTQLNLY
jgi:solute carrier family 41